MRPESKSKLKRKWRRRAVKLLLATVLVVFALDAAFVLLFPRHHLPRREHPADAAVVLGAAPNSPAIQHRALQGLAVYDQGLARQLVLTGGNTAWGDESEAMNMARFLTKGTGLTSRPLVLEDKSGNTYENLLNTKKILPGAKSLVVVTDAYHVPRAFLTAKLLGYEEVFWTTPDSGYYQRSELRRYYLREMLAVTVYLTKFTLGIFRRSAMGI